MSADPEDFETLAAANRERWARYSWPEKVRLRFRTAWDMAVMGEWKIAWISIFSADAGKWP